MKSSDWQRFNEDRNRSMFIDGYMARGYSDRAARAEWASLQKRVAADGRLQDIWMGAFVVVSAIALVVAYFFA